MRIEDTFRVSRPIEQTWEVLLDIERIAPLLPGAQLREIDGEEYRGVVKVKVGPITAQYQGRAVLAEVDEAARRVVIDAAGRDTRGAGNAKAEIVVTMREDGDGTAVAIETELSVTGKVAQLGRGMLAEVSSKLLAQFADNLEADLEAGAPDAGAPEAAEAPGAASPAPVGSRSGAGGAPSGNGSAPGALTAPRRVESVEAQPVDLLDVAGAPVAKRLVPVLLGLVAVVVVWRCRRGRGR